MSCQTDGHMANYYSLIDDKPSGAYCEIQRSWVQTVNSTIEDFGCRPPMSVILGAGAILDADGRHAMCPNPCLHDIFLSSNTVKRLSRWTSN